MRNEPKPLQVYKHFKGNYYQIVEVAKHSETGERLVIYRPLFEGADVYARPLDMFLSEVDHEKYPDVKQKFRFALVTGQHKRSGTEEESAEESIEEREEEPAEGTGEAGGETAEGSEAEPEEKPEGPHDKDVLDAFLDAQTSEEKLDILTGSWKTVTEDNIDNIAVVLDMELTGETLEEKYKEILNCLKLRAKYESSRLR